MREDVDDVARLAVRRLDADRVGEHQRAIAARSISPPSRPRSSRRAKRRPRPRPQIERVEQVEIEIGEVFDRVQLPRRVGAAEPGMRGRDHARAARPDASSTGARRLEADAGMEEQQRPSAAALDSSRRMPLTVTIGGSATTFIGETRRDG